MDPCLVIFQLNYIRHLQILNHYNKQIILTVFKQQKHSFTIGRKKQRDSNPQAFGEARVRAVGARPVRQAMFEGRDPLQVDRSLFGIRSFQRIRTLDSKRVSDQRNCSARSTFQSLQVIKMFDCYMHLVLKFLFILCSHFICSKLYTVESA